MNIYLVGPLRQGLRVREVAAALREDRHYVFDDWQAAHPDADDAWRGYEIERGRNYPDALRSPFARAALQLDWEHLIGSQAVVLVAKKDKLGGFSAAAELTWAKCKGKRTYVLLDGEPDRWELMAPLAVDPDNIVYNIDSLRRKLQ